MSVRELLERMDAAEFGEWMAFADDEPFGGVVEDYRAGLIAASVVNNAGFNRPKEPRRPMQFFPWHDPERYMTDEQHDAAVDDILNGAAR